MVANVLPLLKHTSEPAMQFAKLWSHILKVCLLIVQAYQRRSRGSYSQAGSWRTSYRWHTTPLREVLVLHLDAS